MPSLGAAETHQAIAAAAAAFPAWRGAGAGRRAELLEAWYDAMIANLEDLARIMTLEQGKPLAESRGEVRYGGGFVKWFSEEARRVYGDTIPAPTPIAGSSCSRSRSACVRRSRRGTFRSR